ncbi:MAG: hypothetical protein ACWGSD_07135 [Thermodesulfobacteriota bacterium]
MEGTERSLELTRVLGSTGLSVGRLGISSSFGAPARAFEEAFERGCNYFTWGTFIKGRSGEMQAAIKNICRAGARERLVLAMLSYAHDPFLTELFLKRGLKRLGIEYTDILILGYFSSRPSRRILDGARKLVDAGMVRYVGLTSHNRKLFSSLHREGLCDVFHIRYSAAHRGAETETFPHLTGPRRPGIVTFTATAWRKLLDSKKMPAGVPAPPARDCYRFVLSNPSVDVCMMGAGDLAQMRENLTALDLGPLNPEEVARMRRIGEHVHR